jgi:hypothetical protein
MEREDDLMSQTIATLCLSAFSIVGIYTMLKLLKTADRMDQRSERDWYDRKGE